MRILILLNIFAIGLTSCRSTFSISDQTTDSEWTDSIAAIFERDSTFSQALTGLVVKDLATKDLVFNHQGDKYFTPASNTKLLTFYTSLNILDDSIVGIKYYENADSLIIWGTGDPTLLNPFLSENSLIIDFLKRKDKAIYVNFSNFQEERYGSGWSWDDYKYGYQTEMSSLPMYSNLVAFSKPEADSPIEIDPPYFKLNSLPNMERQRRTVEREEGKNLFYYDYYKVDSTYNILRYSPYIIENDLVASLLEDEVGRSVSIIASNTHLKAAESIYSGHADSLYRLLLQPSDNFVAEHLLLNCSSKLFDTLNTEMVIDWAKKHLFSDMPDEFQWVDGSGLSRYNMISPQNIIYLLEELYMKVEKKRLFELLPTNGVSGTIKNLYLTEQPFIHAKTGSLSNNHCLSGYLIGDSGKIYAFSFMNSNYVVPTRELKSGMDKVLRILKANL